MASKPQLEGMVRLLAERLAVGLVFIQAIDELTDPFNDIDVQKSWATATLAARGKSEIFKGAKALEPTDIDCSELIKSVYGGTPLHIQGSPIYDKSIKAIREMIRNGINITDSTDSEKAPF